MISMENLVGKQVFMVLRDVKALAPTGLEQEENVFVVRGHEPRHGVWVEAYISGCPVKSGGKSLEGASAVIFVPWHHIVTVIHFPNHSNIEMDQPRQRRIGFRQNSEE